MGLTGCDGGAGNDVPYGGNIGGLGICIG